MSVVLNNHREMLCTYGLSSGKERSVPLPSLAENVYGSYHISLVLWVFAHVVCAVIVHMH